MPVNRRRFRIEEAFAGDMPISELGGGDSGPMQREIMAELRAIRAQMASAGHRAAMRQFDCADPAGHRSTFFPSGAPLNDLAPCGRRVEQWLTSIVVGSCVGPLLAPLP